VVSTGPVGTVAAWAGITTTAPVADAEPAKPPAARTAVRLPPAASFQFTCLKGSP
jgi:hypothetical protein